MEKQCVVLDHSTPRRQLDQLVHELFTQQNNGSKYEQKSKLQSRTALCQGGHQQRKWSSRETMEEKEREHLFVIIKCKYKQPFLNGNPHCITHCCPPPPLHKA